MPYTGEEDLAGLGETWHSLADEMKDLRLERDTALAERDEAIERYREASQLHRMSSELSWYSNALVEMTHERDEIVGLLRELCMELFSGALRSTDEVRGWLSDRIPGTLKAPEAQ